MPLVPYFINDATALQNEAGKKGYGAMLEGQNIICRLYTQGTLGSLVIHFNDYDNRIDNLQYTYISKVD